jgi:crossover junction endodeoxyribonuclease RuvC
MFTIGIDPGSPLTIGVLVEGSPYNVYSDEEVAVHMVKTGRKTASWVNQASLITGLLRALKSEAAIMGYTPHVIIERVTIRPNESLSAGVPFVGSMFLSEGICAGLRIPYKLVPPSVWKPAMKIQVTLQNPKEPARLRALELWPDRSDLFTRKKDHNRAEALLMARYWDQIGSKA